MVDSRALRNVFASLLAVIVIAASAAVSGAAANRPAPPPGTELAPQDAKSDAGPSDAVDAPAPDGKGDSSESADDAAPDTVKEADAEKPATSDGASSVTPSLPKEWVDTLKWRCIGPANMGGRITSLAVFADDPSVYWVATASGGLLKTINNGITFEHQFDHEATVSIGDVAVAPSDQNVVWVGTGEANPRNSVSWGNGVYKSVDGGKTWKHMGLEKTFQIARVVIHPTDPDIVYVGALGRLWGANEQRGLYKTEDGGENWEKVLYVDDETGVIDAQMKPGDPDTLLVGTYQRQRDGFDTNAPAVKFGPGSGLYRTTDAGASFTKLTAGLPSCDLGRIGIDYYAKDPDTVFVVLESEHIANEPDDAPYAGIRGEDVEVGARITEIVEDGPASKTDLKVGDIVVRVCDATTLSYADMVGEFRKHSAGDTAILEVSRDKTSVLIELAFGHRPETKEEEAEDIPDTRRRPKRTPFASMLGGQRENLQEQQGDDGHEYGGVYKSTDGGENWKRINTINPRPMYFSEVRVDPSDEQHMFVLGISLYRSKDAGKTFTSDGGRGVHSDHHALWIDPKDGRHMILGGDGGLYVTHDRMEKWDHLNHMAIGQFYDVGVGPRRNYRVYGGLQDNGSWGGPSRARSGGGPINEDWFRVGGGDGFVCRVDPNNADLVYYESQNGNIGRVNLRTGKRGISRPRPPKGTKYRFNWKTPFLLSHHNSKIYYAAGSVVLKSLDRGNGLKSISPEITRTDRGSATALAESPVDADVLYVGTDDGALWGSKNGGHEWTKLIGFPGDPDDDDKASNESEEGEATDAASDSSGTSESADTGVSEPTASDRASRRSAAGAGDMVARIMKRDANGDGKIQESEAPKRMKPMFGRIDADGDGGIDRSELAVMAERMGRRGRGDHQAPPPGDRAKNGHARSGHGDAEPARKKSNTVASASDKTESPESTKHVASGSASDPHVADAQSEPAPQPSAVEANDPLTGEWSAHALIEGASGGDDGFALSFKIDDDGKVTGTMDSQMGNGPISDASFKPKTGKLRFTFESEMAGMEFTATVSSGSMNGFADIGNGMFTFDFTAKRTSGRDGSDVADAGDEAYEWKSLTELLPGPRWVSSIEASRYAEGRCYVTLDGHRSNDDEPYVFLTENHGETWRSIRASLPTSAGSTRVLREDIENENLLYLGTEFGAWVSIDRGRSWTRFNSNLPTVAIHEFAIHPTAGEIVAATHGRSLWVLDVTPLRQMAKQVLDDAATLYKPSVAIYWQPRPGRGGGGARSYTGENPSGQAQIFYSLSQSAGNIELRVADLSGRTIRELEVDSAPGLHNTEWNLRRKPRKRGSRDRSRGGRGGGGHDRFNRGRLVESGKYLVELMVDDEIFTQFLSVETDPENPDYRPWELEEEETWLYLTRPGRDEKRDESLDRPE